MAIEQRRRNIPPRKPIRSLEERFWEKVQISDGCWLWTHSKTNGYGAIGRGGRSDGKVYAHVASWEIATESRVPSGRFVCHTCDVPSCVNPEHLFLGTPADNVHDSMSKGRHIKGERVGGCKLTADRVRQIRALYDRGITDKSRLGRRFGVTRRNIAAIVERRSWKHVP